jgi:hypothetical protein
MYPPAVFGLRVRVLAGIVAGAVDLCAIPHFSKVCAFTDISWLSAIDTPEADQAAFFKAEIVQTAKMSGLPDKTVRGIIGQLADTAGAKTGCHARCHRTGVHAHRT